MKAGIGARLLAKYESDETEPGATNLRKIADAFDYPLPWDLPTARYLGHHGWPIPDPTPALALAGG